MSETEKRFIRNKDGTITDKERDLTWRPCSSPSSPDRFIRNEDGSIMDCWTQRIWPPKENNDGQVEESQDISPQEESVAESNYHLQPYELDQYAELVDMAVDRLCFLLIEQYKVLNCRPDKVRKLLSPSFGKRIHTGILFPLAQQLPAPLKPAVLPRLVNMVDNMTAISGIRGSTCGTSFASVLRKYIEDEWISGHSFLGQFQEEDKDWMSPYWTTSQDSESLIDWTISYDTWAGLFETHNLEECFNDPDNESSWMRREAKGAAEIARQANAVFESLCDKYVTALARLNDDLVKDSKPPSKIMQTAMTLGNYINRLRFAQRKRNGRKVALRRDSYRTCNRPLTFAHWAACREARLLWTTAFSKRERVTYDQLWRAWESKFQELSHRELEKAQEAQREHIEYFKRPEIRKIFEEALSLAEEWTAEFNKPRSVQEQNDAMLRALYIGSDRELVLDFESQSPEDLLIEAEEAAAF